MTEPQWPPRSPHEALLSSPSGRNRLRQQRSRLSPSPSPLKTSRTTPKILSSIKGPHISSPTGSDEEDEETLQLELKALEARIKLKKLQQRKSRADPADTSAETNSQTSFQSASKENRSPLCLEDLHFTKSGSRNETASRYVQVAGSPQKRLAVSQEHTSPRKVLLGIDKGLTGKNVSLRRAPSTREGHRDPCRANGSTQSDSNTGGLARSKSVSDLGHTHRTKTFSERIKESRQDDRRKQEATARIRRQQSSGFGLQKNDLDKAKQQSELDAADLAFNRSTVPSGYSREEILRGATRPDSGLIRRSNTGPKPMSSRDTPNVSNMVWKTPNSEPETLVEHPNLNVNILKPEVHRSARDERSPERRDEGPGSTQNSDTLFEPFSSTHLSRRVLPHDLLTRTFSQKSILLLPHLLQHVKSPEFCLPPDLEVDYVVLGTIASKSSPLTHKDSVRAKYNTNASDSVPSTSHAEAAESEQNTKGKYMVLTLTDLKWTVHLYLFDTAYTRFWKLDPGTVVALLNPSIMPPPPGRADTGRFSLVLNSSDDTVLEIGTSRDLGWCSSVRKDGKPCSAWVDKRHTSVCEFHVDRIVERTRRGRMEVQGMSAPFAPGGRQGGRTGLFGTSGRRGNKSNQGGGTGKDHDNGLLHEGGAQYDRASKSTYFMSRPAPIHPNPFATANRGGTASVAQLLDADRFDNPFDRGAGSKEERLRKRLAEREREAEIARKLGEGGNGAGGEYLRLHRAKNGPEQTSSSSAPSSIRDGDAEQRSARGRADGAATTEDSSSSSLAPLLQLRANASKAAAVQLSPLRKQQKRKDHSVSPDRSRSPTTRSSGPKKTTRDAAPVDGNDRVAVSGSVSARKKTRFVTAKGIKVAGRDSLGGATTATTNAGAIDDRERANGGFDDDDDDEDDELEVV